jgi:dephospho-CoA kinase
MSELKNAIVVTGGIGTGKSTVCSLLALYGFKIIDADKITARLLVKYHNDIENLFGKKFYKDGVFDKKALGKIVFCDEKERKKLEEFLHPKIKAIIIKEASFCEESDVPYILDIPLYFENGNYDIKEVVVVYSTKEQQWERVSKRGYEFDKTKQRIIKSILEVQMDIEEKRKRAKYVIDNSKDFKYLQKEVEKFLDYIRKKYVYLKI